MVENWISSSKSMSSIFGKSSSRHKENEVEGYGNIVNLGDFSSIKNDNLNNNVIDRGKGSLLRLFQSDVFDAHLHLYYMYHHKEYGVHEYLVNLLYEKSDDVLWYLPQLCEISMNRYDHSSLWKFFLDKSSENMNFSLILSWMYQAISEDNIPVISLNAQNMLQEIEMAVVNSKLKPNMRYIEKRLFNWRKSKICLFQNNSIDFYNKFNYNESSSYLNRISTEMELPQGICTRLPSNETIDNIDDVNEEIIDLYEKNRNLLKDGLISLSSCDILPDIWIYRIINDDLNIDYKFEYIRNRLDIINRQFKNLYSNLSSAAHYNPNPNNNCNTISSGFGSLNTGFSVNIITGSSINNGINNSNKISIPYFFFTKLGSPFDLIDVNKIITDIQFRCRSRINKLLNNSIINKNKDYVNINENINDKEQDLEIDYENENNYDLNINFKSDIINNEEVFKVYISEIEKESETLYYLLKQHRCNYFNRVNQLVSQMLEISNFLQSNIIKEHRNEILEFIIEELNLWLFYSRFSIAISRTTFLLNSISLPMLSFNNIYYQNNNDYKLKSNDKTLLNLSHSSFMNERRLNSLNNCQFLRIIPNECKVFNSRKRVHFLLAIEIADLDDNNEFEINSQELISMDILNYLKNHGIKLKNDNYEFKDYKPQDILIKFLNILSIGISDSNDQNLIKDDLNEVMFIEKNSIDNKDNNDFKDENINEDNYENNDWPQETWSSKILRYKKESPYSKLKSWNIKTILLKSSDDLRQELLASQLLQQFEWIFKINNLPLWLHPYEILVIGSRGGFIEYIQDTFSIDSLKRKFQTDNLLHCFDQLFKNEELKTKARKCFVESHAAYSLVSYFLQVKDRHNGNFLIDKYGHIIQIDYGFMLSNSPGNVNFEQSPFKLTQEFLDVMLGENSSEFQYFQQLVIKGFLACRKYVDQIVLTIEAMTTASKLPCFSLSNSKYHFIQEVRDRFFLHLTEEQCVVRITELIQTSINNWRSIQYDAFQRITNGIL